MKWENNRKVNKKPILFYLLSSIMQGVGVALLFVPAYKELSVALGAFTVVLGLGLFVTGICIRLRCHL